MNDPGATLIILFFRAPRILEGTERSQNGATNPDRIFTFWRGSDLNLSKILRQTSSQKQQLERAAVSNERQTMLEGASAVSSFCIRSAMPGNIVVPPERTTFPYTGKSVQLGMSRSQPKISRYL
jgi:hypothetical protein